MDSKTNTSGDKRDSGHGSSTIKDGGATVAGRSPRKKAKKTKAKKEQ